MRNACDKKIEHRSKVKVKENMKTTISAITFEPEVVETFGLFKNVPCRVRSLRKNWHKTEHIKMLL